MAAIDGRVGSYWRHLWLAVGVLGPLAMLQGSGLGRLSSRGIGPDLVLCGVIAWAFVTDSGAGAVWGFVGGLMLDCLSAGPFGVHSLGLTFVGVVVGSGRLGLYPEQWVWAVVAAASGSALYYFVSLMALHVLGWPFPFVTTFNTIVLPSIGMDLLGVIVLLGPLRVMKSRLLAGSAPPVGV